MPLYDFKCTVCGRVRLDQKFKTGQDADRANLYCSSCTGSRLQRLPAAPDFVVTGYNAKNGYSTK